MNNSNSRFLHNEGCPRCGSRDNVAVYDDGHKWCFGCSYYVPGKDTLESINRKLVRPSEEELDSEGIDSRLFSTEIPERALKWLARYGVSERERYFHNIYWCDYRQTLVFPVIREGKITLTNERYFGKESNHPKYLTFGNKNKEILVLKGPTYDRAILVEDVVSAIKVSRLVTAIPLMGTKCPESALEWLRRNMKAVGVWLDLDKAAEALREASRLSQTIKALAIVTEMDPKEYTTNQINDILKKYRVLDKGGKNVV